MAYSNAQKEATARYNKKAYDRIEIKVKKGRKEQTRRMPPNRIKASISSLWS